MNLNDIYEIMEKFEDSSLTSFALEVEEFSLKLGKGTGNSVPAVISAQPAAPATSAVPAAPAAGISESGEFVKAPLVGTFYKASAPDAEPFVSGGKAVKKGETVCLIEAMKMINEVPAPCDCVIEKILAEDGTLVEYDQPLFLIKKG